MHRVPDAPCRLAPAQGYRSSLRCRPCTLGTGAALRGEWGKGGGGGGAPRTVDAHNLADDVLRGGGLPDGQAHEPVAHHALYERRAPRRVRLRARERARVWHRAARVCGCHA